MMSSADWMVRNFHRRVEIGMPIESPACKKRLIEEGLEVHLQPGNRTWELQMDGEWIQSHPEGDDSQRQLLEALRG